MEKQKNESNNEQPKQKLSNESTDLDSEKERIQQEIDACWRRVRELDAIPVQMSHEYLEAKNLRYKAFDLLAQMPLSLEECYQRYKEIKDILWSGDDDETSDRLAMMFVLGEKIEKLGGKPPEPTEEEKAEFIKSIPTALPNREKQDDDEDSDPGKTASTDDNPDESIESRLKRLRGDHKRDDPEN